AAARVGELDEGRRVQRCRGPISCLRSSRVGAGARRCGGCIQSEPRATQSTESIAMSPESQPEMPTSVTHVPVMLSEMLELLRPFSGGRYVDGTLGGGGHAEAILEASAPDGELLGIDWDEDARGRARRRLEDFAARVHVVAASFDEIGDCLERLGWDGADGIVVDLGVSSFQLDIGERGFSFSRTGPLDMRMNRSGPRPLGEWLHDVSEKEL